MNRFHDEQLEDFAEAQQGGGGGCQQEACSPLLDFRCTKCLGGGIVMSEPNRWGCSSEIPCDECGGRGSVPTEKQIADLSRRLASKLWDCSALRHGMFTPSEFRRLCESVILAALSPENVQTLAAADTQLTKHNESSK